MDDEDSTAAPVKPASIPRHGQRNRPHASMRLAPEERRRTVTDKIWESMALQMLAEVGIATTATDPGLRWIAKRYADDHMHIVATLVREDGRTNWLRNDYPRCVKATYNAARRYNLHRRVPPAGRTAHRRPHPVEVSKARRTGRVQTPRDELRRRVRTGVAAAGSEDEFFARLREAGVLVRLRRSSTDPRNITRYTLALPGARTAGRQPVYFGGGGLAPDMTRRSGLVLAAGAGQPLGVLVAQVADQSLA
ncbi:hypothetical protein [Micromonospora purpureochromogenes]|uniref:hypothetical protein n=1 Tax=Micromonospora purpureochromogenes TaxID=47872 RepID=UPI0018D4E392|nr:hypothetical protein [Micromonospora purpureochromogenes]